MKKILYLLLPVIIFLLSSCHLLDKKDDDNSNDPNVVNGSSSIPMNQIGNSSPIRIYSGNSSIDVGGTVTVKKVENGITTLTISADLTKDTKLAKLNSIIPSSMKDNTGKINTDVRFKITDAGIQDFVLKDKPHTIAKFDCKVGDKYEFTRNDGVTITRTVTEKTDQNDFSYGLYYIKTIKTEESASPGIKKIVYRTNHKFGLVYVEMTFEDNSVLSTYLYPTYNN